MNGRDRMNNSLEDLELLESLFILVEPGLQEKTRIIRFVRSFGFNAFLQSLSLFDFSTETQKKLNHYRYVCNYLGCYEKGNEEKSN